MTCPARKLLFSLVSVCAVVLCSVGLATASQMVLEIQHDVLAASIESGAAEFEPSPPQAIVPEKAEDQLLSVQDGHSSSVSDTTATLPSSGSDLVASGSETDALEDAQPIPEPTSVALIGCLGSMLFLIYGMRSYFDRNAAK